MIGISKGIMLVELSIWFIRVDLTPVRGNILVEKIVLRHIPDLGMVLVATCLLTEANRGREEIRRLHLFMDNVTRVAK